MKLLNTSKVSTDNKITVIKEVADKLKITKGDMIGFFEDENKNIIVQKVTIKSV